MYIPLGGSRKGKGRTIINIAVVWLLTGFWHGANLTFVLWGVVYGFLVLAEKIMNTEERLKKARTTGKALYRMFTLLMIMFLWVLFRTESIQEAGHYLLQMFQFGTIGFEATVLYLSEYKYAIIGCIILSVLPIETMMKRRTISYFAA